MDSPILDDLRNKRLFSWQPTVDTWVALLTAIAWIGGYYLLVHLPDGPVASVYAFAALLLLVVFPVWWLCWHRGRPLQELGITSRYWKESVIISTLVAIPFLWTILTQFLPVYGAALVPHFIGNALILWEPFFVFCWLELRFGKAFGLIPGIVLAGGCFAAYHIGTYPPPLIVSLFVFGMLFAAIFRLTDNLLSMWPLAWAMTSARGTLVGGMVFSWDYVVSTLVILIVQLLFIAWTWKRIRSKERVAPPPGHQPGT